MQQKPFWCNTKRIQGINPMGFYAPWVNYKNKQFFTNMKIKQNILICNKKICKELTQWALVPLGAPLYNTYLHSCKLECIEELPLTQ